MIHFYFKDKLINDFFYKDVFCVPVEIALKLNKELVINFVGSEGKINNPYLGNKNIKIHIHKNYLSMFLYFLKNIRTINIFGLFHIYNHSILFTYIYKLFNNRGKVFIKGDFNVLSINNLVKLYDKYTNIIKYLLNKIDIISFENLELYNIFDKNISYNNKTIILKNSLYTYEYMPNNNIDIKENVILAIGRIYFEEAKRYSFLLKALLKIDSALSDWEIIFIGNTKGKFLGKKFDFLLENKQIIEKLELKGIKIKFFGPIYDRNKLYDFLNRSKIFCISSSSEGDPLVQYESMYYSNIMVSTNVGTISENYYNKGMFISNIDDIEQYKNNLLDAVKLTSNGNNIKNLYNNIHNYCVNNYTRDNNLKELINELKGN